MKYNFEIEKTSESSVWQAVCQVPSGSRVLEFGTATGYMTRYLKEQLGCRVTGVELDQEAAALAAQYCEKMIVGDINSQDWKNHLAGEKFDCITFIDVLEHLVNPGRTLADSLEFIKDDGLVITSIPNIGFNGVVMDLLQSRFIYRELGIIEETHLRFFTRQGVCELLQQAGLSPVKWLAVVKQPEYTEFNQQYSNFPEEIENYLRAREDAQIYQYVTVSKPPGNHVVQKNLPQAIEDQVPLQGEVLQVFWADKDGFFEESSLNKPIKYCSEFIEYNFTLPEGNLTKLRLDPGSQPAFVEIMSIELTTGNGDRDEETESVFTCSAHNAFSRLTPGSGVIKIKASDVYYAVCVNNDPQIELSLEDITSAAHRQLTVVMRTEKRLSPHFAEILSVVDIKKRMLLQEKESQIIQQKGLLNEMKFRIGEQENLLKEQGNLLKEQDGLLWERLSEINDLTMAVNQLIPAQQKLERITSSKFWALSRPIRRLKRKISGSLRRIGS